MSAKKTGDWGKAGKSMTGAADRLRRARTRAVKQEAQLLKREIVQGLTSGQPGGRPISELEPTTIATRRLRGVRGTKPLIARGDLRRGITVVGSPSGGQFIGILRSATNREGERVANLAAVHEFGKTIVVRLTPASRRFLMLVLRQAGRMPTGPANETGIAVVRIPARPFLRPAFKKFSKGAAKRFAQRIARELRGQLGKAE